MPSPNIVPGEMVEVTGAGDALNAGLIYGLLEGKDLKESVKPGIRAAMITLASERTVNQELKKGCNYSKGGMLQCFR